MAEKLDNIIKGNVITVANQKPRAEAIGIKGEKIVAVGSLVEVGAYADENTRVLDLRGKTILPGFMDSHAHPMGTAKNLQGVDLSTVTTILEAVQKIRERVNKTPEGKLVFCPDYNRLQVAEKRFPTRKELDAISSKHPIYIQHFDGHFHMVNSPALTILGFTSGMEGVETDAAGELTGMISDPASAWPLRSGDTYSNEDDFMEALILVTNMAASVGITTLFAKEGLENAQLIMKNIEKLPVRIHPMAVWHPPDDINKIAQAEFLGNRKCIAAVADGSGSGHTAAMFEPYTNDPDTLGMLYYTDAEMYDFVEKAHQAGLQISIHAESDRSIEQVLRTYEKVLKKYPCEDHRHRIEHFEFPAWHQLRYAARLGVALAMQPMFTVVCGGPGLDYYRTYLGDERVKRTQPFRSILNEGILVGGGSDTPVTRMNPLGGISSLVNHPNEAQRIELWEAIEMFTINNAKIGFEEEIKGSIEEGKLADFVVLSDDPYHTPRERIGDIKVEMTIVGGRITFNSNPSS
jgi:predicted amidohydrolase YtcJ